MNNITIGTLGPSGTSSEQAAKFYIENSLCKSAHVISLFDNFNSVLTALERRAITYAIIPNAYALVSEFYINPRLKFTTSFVFNTPSYSLVCNSSSKLDSKSCIIAIHPATSVLVEHLLSKLTIKPDDHTVVYVNSTVTAAEHVYQNKAKFAITNALGAEKFRLKKLVEYGPITMLWSVFENNRSDK